MQAGKKRVPASVRLAKRVPFAEGSLSKSEPNSSARNAEPSAKLVAKVAAVRPNCPVVAIAENGRIRPKIVAFGCESVARLDWLALTLRIQIERSFFRFLIEYVFACSDHGGLAVCFISKPRSIGVFGSL